MVDNSSGDTIFYSPSTELTRTTRVTFGTDGHITFYTSYLDCVSPFDTSNATVNGPTFATLNTGLTVWVYKFPTNQSRNVSLWCQIPHNYEEGTNIIPHIHFIPQGGTIGQTINWVIEYTWMNIGTTIPVSQTSITRTYTTVTGDTNKHITLDIPNSSGISGTGKTISSILTCRVWRNVAADNWNGNVCLLAVDFHYKVNSLGSLNVAVK
jgi:hypothetical protein